MGISVSEIVTGRKTFFILPDTSLIPETYLEDYFSIGYECYFIENDKRVHIQKKVDVIISLFKDLILFFNIDYNIPGFEWDNYVRELIQRHDNAGGIGIVFAKRQTKDERARIENKYLYEMGVRCGCIQLEYQKKQNFELIAKILFANQAQGRRKTIRALCTSACTYSCTYGNGQSAGGVLQDISLSHFTILSPGTGMNIQLYEKIHDIHFNIRGFLFRSDALLVMERPINGDVLYVFAFVTSSGANGLDQRVKQLLIPNMYKLLNTNCKTLLDQLYNKLDNEAITEIEEVEDDIL
ncbi:MAG: hypothetical protein J6X84_00600 [Treponema sp.]|nr:hypothetical protein [Treponema sp.]